MIDDTNPLHRASFHLERMKYGPEGGVDGVLMGMTPEQSVAYLEVLLRAANVTSMSGAELSDAFDYYADNYSRMLGLPHLITRSIFMDGAMHGIALAAGLDADPPGPVGGAG